MRTLLIFSGWVPADGDGHAWSTKYAAILCGELADHDKIIIYNYGCHDSLKIAFARVPNIVASHEVGADLDVGSDASGYQLGLFAAKGLLDQYDVVSFVHSKGASHKFADHSLIIESFCRELFAPGILSDRWTANPNAIYITQAYLTCINKSIEDLRKICDVYGGKPSISITVTSSIFAVSASVLKRCVHYLPANFFSTNLMDQGFDRWFFETVFPSLLVAHGADICFTGKSELIENLNNNLCYYHYPSHNGAVIENELKVSRELGAHYLAAARPFIFGPNMQDSAYQIAYDPTREYWNNDVKAVCPSDAGSLTGWSSEKGRVVRTKSAGEVYFIKSGFRHWVMRGEWFAQNGFTWPTDVEFVEEDELQSIPLGRPAPRAFAQEMLIGEPSVDDPLVMREIACSILKGHGVEFGAGANPLPIPLNAGVEYSDLFSHEELLGQLYTGQTAGALLRPAFKIGLDQTDLLAGKYDFFAAAHVIEHLPNPIGAICSAATRLLDAGKLLLVVPDMTRTFDSKRSLTELSHLVDDYYAPDFNRDAMHFQEFYLKAFETPAAEYEAVWTRKWQDRFPIHYHTWTYESFREMANWIITNTPSYKSHKSFRTRGNEFYFIFSKY